MTWQNLPSIPIPSSQQVDASPPKSKRDDEPNSEQLDRALPKAMAIIARYPEFARNPPDAYLAEITAFIALLDEEKQNALCHRTEGIVAHCPKFPPSTGQMIEFLRMPEARREAELAERQRIAEKFRLRTPEESGWPRLKPGPVDKPDAEEIARRKAVVVDALGYDPAKPRPRIPLDKATQKKIDDGTWSIDDLKTPARPASKELKANIAARFDWRA